MKAPVTTPQQPSGAARAARDHDEGLASFAREPAALHLVRQSPAVELWRWLAPSHAMRMQDIRIIPTAEEHVESLHLCLDEVARERRHLAFLEAPPLEGVRGFVRALTPGGGIQVLALDDAGIVVGWCDILPGSQDGFRHCGRLGMGLLARARGVGIGTRLASAALDRAWEAGLERVELEVFASNEFAIRLYRKLGFATEGVKRQARKLDGAYDDIVVMALVHERGSA